MLLANAFVHFGLLPIDPIAWASGTFHTLGSFVPNTALHVAFGGLALWSWARPRS